jgi:predicted RNase H-like HicB family nuclease
MRMLIDGYSVGFAVARTIQGDEQFAVWPLDMPGCIAQGDSMPEATKRLQALLPTYIAALRARGATVPDPTKVSSVAIAYATFNMNYGAIPDSSLWPMDAVA